MRIALVALSGVRIHSPELRATAEASPGFLRRAETIASLPSLGLLTVAGMTPSEHDVDYFEVDDLASAPDLSGYDVVGISSLTARIEEAYLLADGLRRDGTTVVLGGLHVSVMPDEALTHADAIVVDAAEGAWAELLDDIEEGELRAVYRGARRDVFDDDHYVRPAFDLLRGRKHNRVTVQTSRGCPRRCEFCGASPLVTDVFNQKSVARAVDEILAARSVVAEPFFELADDNSFLDQRWSKEFLRAVRSCDIRFFAETDASVADDEALCDLLAAAGCKQVLIGFESPFASDLGTIDPVGWKQKRAPSIRRVVDTLQSRDIRVNGCFVLGLDSHEPDVFPRLFEFVAASGMSDVQYTVLTPFPGTPLYARLRSEGRLLEERFWRRCTLFDVNYVPRRMSVDELEAGMRWLFEKTYRTDDHDNRIDGFSS